MKRRFKTAALACLALLLAGCAEKSGPEPGGAGLTLVPVPAADGSMAPNLARGPANTAILSWIEPDGDGHALRYAVFAGGDWGEVRTVTSGREWFVNWADIPSVVPLSDTLWAAHWLARREAGGYSYDIHVAISRDAGDSWSEPFVPHTDGTDTEHGFVSIYPDARGVGMVWLDGRKMENEYDENDVAASGMTLRAAVFSPDRVAIEETLLDDLICDCCQTDVAVTPRGPVAVYRDRTVDEVRDIYVTGKRDGAWQPGKPVADDAWEIWGCPVNGPAVQARYSQIAVAWFSASDDEPRVQLAWSSDAGATLAPPIVVAAGDLLGHVGVALLPSGDAAVTWLAKSGTDGAELRLRRVSAAGILGIDIIVANDAASFSVPQIVALGDDLLVAWTSGQGEQRAVRAALISAAGPKENGP